MITFFFSKQARGVVCSSTSLPVIQGPQTIVHASQEDLSLGLLVCGLSAVLLICLVATRMVRQLVSWMVGLLVGCLISWLVG